MSSPSTTKPQHPTVATVTTSTDDNLVKCPDEEKKNAYAKEWSNRKNSIKKGLPIDHIDELFETFTLFDKNYNGAINDQELNAIMQSISLNVTSTEIKDMIAEADADADGRIDFPEFISFMARKTDDSHMDLTATFDLFDPLKTGFINSKNLIDVLECLDELDHASGLNRGEIEKLFKEASIYGTKDKNGEYALNFREFHQMMQSVQNSSINAPTRSKSPTKKRTMERSYSMNDEKETTLAASTSKRAKSKQRRKEKASSAAGKQTSQESTKPIKKTTIEVDENDDDEDDAAPVDAEGADDERELAEERARQIRHLSVVQENIELSEALLEEQSRRMRMSENSQSDKEPNEQASTSQSGTTARKASFKGLRHKSKDRKSQN